VVSATTVTAATAVEAATTATAVESTTATAVEATGTAAVEAAATTVHRAKVATVTASKAVATIAARVSATIAVIWVAYRATAIPDSASVVSVPIAIASSVAIAVAIPTSPAASVVAAMPVAATPVSMSPVAVVPRAGADKEPTDEPAGAIKAVGRAGVWIVVVIAPRTDRGWAVSIAIATIVIAVVAAVVARAIVLRLGPLGQRQWRGEQAKREYPSENFFHTDFPHSAPFVPLTRMAAAVQGSQRLALVTQPI
jgi:hypothetical protein